MFEANINDIKACIEDALMDRCWPEEISDQELDEVLAMLDFDFDSKEEDMEEVEDA